MALLREEVMSELVKGITQRTLRMATPEELAMHESIGERMADMKPANGRFGDDTFTAGFRLNHTGLGGP